MSSPAPTGGVTVHLTSSNPAVASAPSTVVVPEGATASPAFQIATTSVTAQTGVRIAATYNGAGVHATLVVVPLALAKVTLNPASVTGGTKSFKNTVVLNAPAPAGGLVVDLQSSNTAAARVPASVTVPPGATYATFGVATSTVTTTTAVTISATYNSVTRTATLTVNP